ncbi:multidrug DMT transporter permease [Citrobacter sp. NCU1]|uniref:Dam family site-specific DNA-(adenine-N6)-methyltransferase n=1 Tax=Citrobacter sp. NCU1 TaxID=2026683 RepID=UPI0013910C3C|nr:multidrug DMT transporter permease [Citrobacter sp. NCU1]
MNANFTANHQLTYGSVCSGVEAASLAWEGLGLKPVWFAEIEKFPSAVLAHHWPNVPNLGDMTLIADKIRAGEIEAPDVLVGGTPCQAFSLAGLRQGMDDERGQLTLAFVELANAIDDVRTRHGKNPCIIVWENVPGIFSSADNAFGCYLAGLGGENVPFEPGEKPEPKKNSKFWRWSKTTRQHIPKWSKSGCVVGRQRRLAWRVLDAQYFGVAQRRRRVFVIASARKDVDPSKILLESDGLRRNIAPSRSAWTEIASATGGCTKVGSHWDNPSNPHPTLNQSHNTGGIGASNQELFAQRGSGIILMAHGQGGAEIKTDDSAPTLTCNHEAPIAVLAFPEYMSGTQCATMEGISPSLMSRNPTAIAFNSKDYGQDAAEEIAPTLRASGSVNSNQNAGAPPAVAYGIPGNWIGRAPENGGNAVEPMNDISPCLTVSDRHGVAYGFQPRIARNGRGDMGDICHTLNAQSGETGKGDAAPCVAVTGYSNRDPQKSIRRLTPLECERLQGMPDGHTLIPSEKVKKLTTEEYAYLRSHFPALTAEQAYRLAADGPRYKAIGNSMAVPVMRWLMTRILGELPVTTAPVTPSPVPDTGKTMTPKKRKSTKKAKVETSSFVRPFLKWPGGKYTQLNQILPLIGTGKRLIEPFVGAGSIFINAQGFDQYIGGDTSADLIGLYHGLQQNPTALVDKAKAMFETLNTSDGYKDVREKFNRLHYTPLERAAAFLYLNRHAFNGLMRYNQQGGFNTSYGHYKAPYFPTSEIESFSNMAASCEFHCQSFVDTIRLAGKDDVVFCDPPYMPLPGKDGFTQYTDTPFKDEHQWQLLNEMVAAHQRGARVVATNSGNEQLIEAYTKAGFKVNDLFARRSMSCKGDTREVAIDIVATLGVA